MRLAFWWLYATCVLCVPAGGTFTCAGALTMSAAGSNVRIDIISIALTGAATVDVTSCSPTKGALPSAEAPWVLDPSVPGATSMTCGVNNPTLLQSHFEAGSVAWDVTVGAAAKGGNATIDGNYPVTFTKALMQEPKYNFGIMRTGGSAAVPTAGEAGMVQPSLPMRAVCCISQWFCPKGLECCRCAPTKLLMNQRVPPAGAGGLRPLFFGLLTPQS